MKKLILPAVAGLVIGLGGSTGAVMLLNRQPETLADSLEAALEEGADSLAHADTAAHAVATAHGEGASAPTDSAGVAVHGDSLAHAAGDSVAVPAVADSTGHPLMAAADLAKVFGSMQAREAAAVLQHLNDHEVQLILGQLSTRTAAAILSQLAPERAAVISRAVIQSERTTQ
jgi:hypothetical protein